MRSCFTVFDSIFPGANQQRVFGGKTAGTGTENKHGNRGLSVKAYGKAVRFHCPFQKRKLCWPRRSFRARICRGLMHAVHRRSIPIFLLREPPHQNFTAGMQRSNISPKFINTAKNTMCKKSRGLLPLGFRSRASAALREEKAKGTRENEESGNTPCNI